MLKKFHLEVDSQNEEANCLGIIRDNDYQIKGTLDLVSGGDGTPTEIAFEDSSGLNVSPSTWTPRDQTLRAFVCGQSGCGKTTFVKGLAENFIAIRGSRAKVNLFTTLPFDPVFDKAENASLKLRKRLTKYVIDENVETQGDGEDENEPDDGDDSDDDIQGKNVVRLSLEDVLALKIKTLAGSFVIFDDFLSASPQMRKAIDTLKSIVLKRGRHYDISCAVLNDKSTAGFQSIVELTQSNLLVLFPSSTNACVLARIFKEYLSFSDELVESEIQPLFVYRWIAFTKGTFPSIMVWSEGAKILNLLRDSRKKIS